ncbi:capsid protein [Pea necrotic yellow dwarf virus]|uniref:Capsid protein n=5 Tax=Pea necrotic yellow dwarf virus TaxID=753670 RepID=I6QEN9_9VIRU|nr:capsid protein [Pea necrotic yellow dwarf virus]AFK65511.1 capsid protein [Pea necrotic yellow dwarf virus]AVT42624.1 capsid protein [Pea necrotic yellow dwarf virus]QKG33173.1 capsid protein [Pea necrotic yellow dwarf virus]QKG33174.1 capsid protein [Pea necrotic yellow dwarf virus]WDD44964.1 capsid protein [Pea necrotic yellow dwarf virus]
MAPFAQWAVKKRRTPRGGARRYSKAVAPTTKVAFHQSTVLNKEDIVGFEIKPPDITRYKIRRVVLFCTFRMPPGELLNYLIVKTNSPLLNWGAVFTAPGLMVKEQFQDMVTIVTGGKLEGSGVAGSTSLKAMRKVVNLGAGVAQTQHMYVVFFSSDSMKAILEGRVYVAI